MARAQRTTGAPTQDQVLDSVLAASRVLVAIAVRSLTEVGDEITLVQYRALVVLAYNGPQRTIDLASQLDVNSSTATRLVDRLVRRKLVRRRTHPDDRRATQLEITKGGLSTVARVTARRREEFSKILRRMPAESRRSLVEALEALRQAAGEAPEQSWSLGWTP